MSYSTQIDRKWQKKWEEWGMTRFDPKAPGKKLYCLEMFSYPSAAKLHVGHWYNYALSDSWARLKKMQGYNVFQPMGFDAFGLPAENYAIKTGIPPETSTLKNIATMEEQLKQMGGLFAWDHEIFTCKPDYYKWTQWLFLQLYKHGMAYRKNAPVNWCPSCQTVLANEQVIGGRCERCDSEIQHKNLTQWFFSITKYAQELLDCLPQLDWPEKTKKIQTNWIGRSEGSHVTFTAEKNGQVIRKVDGSALELTVFTTRVDTLLGVSYVVCAPENEIVPLLLTDNCRAEAEAYIAATAKADEIARLATDRPKTGVFTGAYAVHPLTGAKVPIWLSDYVIASYGTGVVMAVPAHDERDYAFATKYNLPVKQVIAAPGKAATELPYCEPGVLTNSGEFDGLTSAEACQAIVAALEKLGRGCKHVNYRLRDWLVSRQRYWGAPIPVIHCPDCGAVPVPEKDLPVLLPKDVEFKPDGKSPLTTSATFMNTTCPCCGKPAQRDPDTLDTFVCSSWYYLRYVDPHLADKPFDRNDVNQMCPVDKYIGGAEHAAMHLLYARFINKALRDMGFLDFDEPFKSLVHQGTILGEDGQKMSKSRGNTISPDTYVNEYGSDVFRLYLAFAFAYTEGGPWSDSGVRAVAKMLNRVERYTAELKDRMAESKLAWNELKQPIHSALNAAEKELNLVLNTSVRGVTVDAERFQFNTSISRIMEVLNAMQKYLGDEADRDAVSLSFLAYTHQLTLRLLAPFAPHFCEEMWEQLSYTSSIINSGWPAVDETALVRDEVEIAVQFNGAVKHRLMIPTAAGAAEVEALVKADETVLKLLGERKIVKFIYIKGRLANLVVK